MVPDAAGRSGARQALVIDDACAGCGLCAGACPASTPFRSIETLRTGIDMPQLPVDVLRRRLAAAVAVLTGPVKVIVFACGRGTPATHLGAADTAVLELLCVGMLPPAFIDFALRGGASGVVVAACGAGDCEFRFGSRWLHERIAGAREPHLRGRVPPDRLRVVECVDSAALAGALTAFRARLRATMHGAQANSSNGEVAHHG
jgi:coenzyme F420-reducing hydrogenase delta subunit